MSVVTSLFDLPWDSKAMIPTTFKSPAWMQHYPEVHMSDDIGVSEEQLGGKMLLAPRHIIHDWPYIPTFWN